MATFFFRAVASDGKVRTGSLSGENDKTMAEAKKRIDSLRNGTSRKDWLPF